jgi:hypothetical protein
MKKIRISYSPDNSQIGTVREVEDDEARTMVREGRGVLVDSDKGPKAAGRSAATGSPGTATVSSPAGTSSSTATGS